MQTVPVHASLTATLHVTLDVIVDVPLLLGLEPMQVHYDNSK